GVKEDAGMSEALLGGDFLIAGFQSGVKKIEFCGGLAGLLGDGIAEVKQLIVLAGLQRAASLFARFAAEEKERRLGLSSWISIQSRQSYVRLIERDGGSGERFESLIGHHGVGKIGAQRLQLGDCLGLFAESDTCFCIPVER